MSGSVTTIWVKDIQYAGDSIGSDLNFVIDAGIGRLEFNKKMSPGDHVVINKQVTQFWSTGTPFVLGTHINVVERDPVYNEAGQAEIGLQVGGGHPGSEDSTVAVTVAETGARSGVAIAQFLVAIRTTVVASERHVAPTENGWLVVVLEDTQERVSLPEALQVEVTRVAAGREFFNIREGAYRGRIASVRLNPDGSSRLTETDPRRAAVTATYSVSRKEFRVGTKRYSATDDPQSPLQLGTYDIEIPDAPHRGGLRYPEATRSRTWFRIGHSGDRYIHTGRASAGCITITEIARWDELASLLVRSRKGDGVSVGKLQVTP
jgi:hypothetical protein